MAAEGYDVEVYEEISSDYYCVICLKLMRNPVQFRCGHGMCNMCFKSLCKKAKQSSSNLQCPQCRVVVKEKQVFLNTMLHRLILQLKVRCSHYDEYECPWIGNLDDLQGHIKGCSLATALLNSTQEGLKRRTRTKSSSTSQEIDTSFQSDLLLSITDHLSTLEKKLDSISGQKGSNQSGASLGKESPPAQEKKRYKKKKIPWNQVFMEKVKLICADSERGYLLFYVLSVILLTSIIYFFTLHLFLSMGNSDVMNSSDNSHGNVVSSFNSASKSSNRNSPSSLLVSIQKDKYELRQADNRAVTHIDGIAGLVLIFIKMEFERMKGLQREIIRDIPIFYEKQNTTLANTKRKFETYIASSRVEMESNITEFDMKSIQISMVENVTSLQPIFEFSANNLNTLISEELIAVEKKCIEYAKSFCENVKERFHSLLNRIHMFSEYDFSDNLYKDELYRVQKKFEELKGNVTKITNSLNERDYIKKVKSDLEAIGVKYQNILTSYYANMSHDLSYGVRFVRIMQAIQNRDFYNGRYIWQLNVSNMSSLPSDRAFISDLFTSIHPYKATLLLYRDKANKGYWKLTFHHGEFLNLNIRISLLNQMNENQLICIESLVGESKRDDTAKIRRFFNIPLNSSELMEKGYLKDNMLYIRCAVEMLK